MEGTAEGDKNEIQQPLEQVELPSDEQRQPSRETPTDSTDLGPTHSHSQPPLKVTKPNKVYIGGLPDDTRQADLEDCFGTFGKIKSIELKTGYGFVEFDSRAAAEKAVAVYHDGIFLGNPIRVELSHGGGKTNQKQLAEPGACFKCGQHGHWARECPNHLTTVHKRPWVDRSSGNYHQRNDSSYRDIQSNLPYSRPRDDYRAPGRPKGDDYVPRPRDYGARDGDFRRPPSPTYDYGREEPLPAPVSLYGDRRQQNGPRPGYGIDRPSSPYRPVGPAYGSRDYDRGYDRAPYYDPRAPPAPAPVPYADRRGGDYGAPQSYPPNHPYSSYPAPRDQAARRSPPLRPGGRYQNYSNQNGYNRPYERRRSASPPATNQYRDEVPPPPGNGYSRNSVPYGRPQAYSSGYGDAANSARGPIAPPVSGPPGGRDYRGGFRP